MSLELVFNELSVQEYVNPALTQKYFSQFVQLLVEAINTGFSRVLRTHEEFFHTIAPHLPLLPKEEKLFLLGLTTKVPFSKDLAQEIIDKNDLAEFLYQDKNCEGLGFAYLLNTLAVSFDDPKWRSPVIGITQKWIEDDDITENQVLVKHACLPEYIHSLKGWMEGQKKLQIRDGESLWNQKELLLNRLIFCESTYNQLKALEPNNQKLKGIINHLFLLQNYCENWSLNTPFTPSNIPGKVKPEGEVALKKFKKEHTFNCPDGQSRLFSWHIYITRSWRIYFEPLPATRQIIIGHVGHHLPTAKFP